jgi:CRP-like cAMP-binding protein
LIISGKVGVSKLIHFEDSKYIERSNDEQLIEMHPIDLIGEDKLWFKRPNQYTAKAISGIVETYYISNSEFRKSYERIMDRVK